MPTFCDFALNSFIRIEILQSFPKFIKSEILLRFKQNKLKANFVQNLSRSLKLPPKNHISRLLMHVSAILETKMSAGGF